MDHTTEDYAQYAEDARPADADNILARITSTAAELREAEAEVTVRQAELQAAQDRVRVLKEKILPEMMDEARQEKLRTSDGWDLEKKETLRASIPPQNMPAASAWLRDHKLDAIIKRDVRVQFSKGDDQKASMIIDMLLENGTAPEDKASVHPMTLASTLKEQLALGVEVPMEIFGAHIQYSVAMKQVKK